MYISNTVKITFGLALFALLMVTMFTTGHGATPADLVWCRSCT